MHILWGRQKAKMPHASRVINAGLTKLAQYEMLMSDVPAYILATSCLFHSSRQVYTEFTFSSQPNNETTMVREEPTIFALIVPN
jgi:hypothetical protein